MFVVFMFQSTVGDGEDFSPGGCSLVVGDWRNFGSNCASAICIQNFLGEN